MPRRRDLDGIDEEEEDEEDEEDEWGEEDEAEDLLSYWFEERLQKPGIFGLLLSSGVVLVVSEISEIELAYDGSAWIEVEVLRRDRIPDNVLSSLTKQGMQAYLSYTRRSIASVNAAHVVAAFDLEDSQA